MYFFCSVSQTLQILDPTFKFILSYVGPHQICSLLCGDSPEFCAYTQQCLTFPRMKVLYMLGFFVVTNVLLSATKIVPPESGGTLLISLELSQGAGEWSIGSNVSARTTPTTCPPTALPPSALLKALLCPLAQLAWAYLFIPVEQVPHQPPCSCCR